MHSIVNKSIDRLFENDKELIDNKMEWAAGHRLARYLEEYYQAWNINCEYSKL